MVRLTSVGPGTVLAAAPSSQNKSYTAVRITVKDLAKILGILLAAKLMAFGQIADKPVSSVKPRNAVESSAKDVKSEADELRERQLRIFREHILTRILVSIKGMDEAGLRLSARNQILDYLTSDKAPTDEKQALATQIARDAVADLREHGAEMLPFMANYLSTNLGGWIQKHRPNLTEDFEKAIKASVKVDPSQRISSLFNLEGGDILAAKSIRQQLETQGSLNGLYFWLDELQTRKSKEFEPLALEVVARAEQGQISFETLFWISDIYLRPQISVALRNRYLAAVVSRTQPANFAIEPAKQMAYQLLIKLLPLIQQSTPELYDQALNQSVAISASLNERESAIEARTKRLKESANPIEDLLSEAESVKSKSERNELKLRAAELALEQKRFDLCLDILSEIEVDIAKDGPEIWHQSIDYVLKNFVTSALAAKHPELSEKGAARIASSLTRVEALNLIMRYCAKTNDKAAAQRLLMEASKVAASATNDIEKAKAFFLLGIICDQVDVSRKSDLLLSGIKALNNYSKPDTGTGDKEIYQDYVRRLDNTGHELTAGFKGLTRQDENGALALVEKIQKPDLKTIALIGILLGLEELIAQPAG